jgi:hypothetical protein
MSENIVIQISFFLELFWIQHMLMGCHNGVKNLKYKNCMSKGDF